MKLAITYVATDKLIPYARNAKVHPPEQIAQIAGSLKEFGFINPVIVDKDMAIIAGHGRVLAAQKLGLTEIPTLSAEHLTAAQVKAFRLADNRIAQNGSWDDELLKIELLELDELGIDLASLGFDDDDLSKKDDEKNTANPDAHGSLADKYVVPPFSVLDTRQGYWQDRRNHWKALGIKSDEGRADDLLALAALGQGGSSIFDPVLCELAYKWFAPEGGSVLDPFAGGSVRGITAAILGLRYHGVDLRAEQVSANKAQALSICQGCGQMPQWVHGNSLNIDSFWPDQTFDFVLSCPPYHDLEKYSNDPEDLSNMPYEIFLKQYREIIKLAIARLKPDRFAVWVVGEIRGKGPGYYKSFVPETIRAFETAGAAFYNEAILVNSVGTLPLRVGRYFNASRKLGKTHQNVLVFVKGNPVVAAKALPDFADKEPEDSSDVSQIS